MATSQPQISLFTEGKSTSSQVDFLVNRTAKPENDLERKMTATSGRKCLEQYGRFSRVGSWERMFSALLIGTGDWYSMKCKLTWKMKGTSYNRMYFQLVPSTHRTDEIEFGLLPTPRAMEVVEHPEAQAERLGDRTGGKLNNLSSGAKFGMLPTPKTWDAKTHSPNMGKETMMVNGQAVNMRKDGTTFGPLLLDMAKAGLLPTPTTQEPSTPCEITATGRRMTKDGKGSHSLNLGRLAGMIPTPTAMDSTGATAKMKSSQVKEGSMHSVTLSRFVGMMPTPMASDCGEKVTGLENQDSLVKMAREVTGKTSQLNPRFVAEMMGFPPNWTESPFLSGDKNP
jgi:hypothetical protein